MTAGSSLEPISDPVSPRASRRLRGVGLASLTLATVGLFFVSRGKWSDAIIDSGREWIVPDSLARGEMLYRDVVYWVAPFTPYVHAAWLRLFGSSLATLAVAGAFDSLAMLGALFLALRPVAGRQQAALWTALAIPVVVFMPASGGILIGMGYRQAATFALLALTFTSRGSARGRLGELGIAGVFIGLAGLCRTEWGIAALAAALVGMVTVRRGRPDLQAILVMIAATFFTFGGVIAAFVSIAGFDPVVRESHLLLTDLPEETRRFMASFSGVGDWRRGIPNVLYSISLWFALFLFLQLLAEIKRNRAQAKLRSRGLILALLLLGSSAVLGGASGPFLWSGAPGLCLFSILVGICRRGRPDSASLASFGSMGLLTSHRRIFHIGNSWYVGNPLLFAFVCAACLLRLAVASERQRESRDALQRSISWTLGVLTALAFGMRMSQYHADQRVAIAGTGGFLSAPAEVASSIERSAAAIRNRTRAGDGLVVFPEGEILNYLSGRPNPCRYKMYLPGYLTEATEGKILEELQRKRPAAIAVFRRQTGEYGPAFFGEDYGRRIGAWIGSNYEPAEKSARSRARILLYFIRSRSGDTSAPSSFSQTGFDAVLTRERR